MMSASKHFDGVAFDALGGMKMTFPFTRRWFLGAEVNYLRSKSKEKQTVYISDEKPGPKLSVERKREGVNVPIYVKYLLGPYGTSLFGGGYVSWINSDKCEIAEEGLPLKIDADSWDAGVSVGVEQRIVKHLNVMYRLNVGLKNASTLPLQHCLTLSFDVFRVGDCGCD